MARLKSYIWVDALRLRAQNGGAFIYIARKGDRDAGAVLLKLCLMDGRARLYVPERNYDLELADKDNPNAQSWMWRASDLLPESEVDALIAKRSKFDPDIWVVEIEDKQGRHFLQEPVME